MIDQNIEPKNLKAHVVRQVLKLTGPVEMCQSRLDRAESFNDQGFDIIH
jgi:hypothetical protein